MFKAEVYRETLANQPKAVLALWFSIVLVGSISLSASVISGLLIDKITTELSILTFILFNGVFNLGVMSGEGTLLM